MDRTLQGQKEGLVDTSSRAAKGTNADVIELGDDFAKLHSTMAL